MACLIKQGLYFGGSGDGIDFDEEVDVELLGGRVHNFADHHS